MQEGSIAMVEAPRHHRFSVEEYHRMGEAGIFKEDDRVELIRGEVVVMTPIGIPHSGCVRRLTSLFSKLGDRAVPSVQNPIQFEDSELQPDLALLAPRDDFYGSRHPGPADALLVVEVADASLRFDREVKGEIYSESGIADYWVVDVQADRVEVYRDPEGGLYREKRTLSRGDRVAPLAFPDFEVPIADVLP